MRVASRVARIDPFYVMECAKAADRIAASPECDPARGGEPMIYLNIGEPDFTAPPGVQRAAEACLAAGRTQYTPALGLPALRERIAGWYRTRWGVDVDPARIAVTAGASAALQLVCLALFEAGDEVLMPDPSYPCNRHFVAAAGGTARLVPAVPAARFQLDAGSVAAHWTPATRGVLLASPSNPTGTSIAPAEMAAIAETVRERGGVTIVDEIYLGLGYDQAFGHTALALGEDIVSINSFSKYFSMTGWRVGWVVLPTALVGAVEKLAQNLFICPSTVAQHAALACFEPEAIDEYERRREEFRRRRDFIVPELQKLGLTVPVVPDGAFYAWADCSRYSPSSWDFCMQMMERAHVAMTPGRDFGPAAAERYLRLSFANSMPQLEAAIARLARELR
ncbi:aspartate/methionine/tyrosine aminotransferase [Rubrivivax gelatinosus]|uniref:pyridoxal phosphate-dependent aminotransferase n=2 Tax=Rubrivivax gelatinosus TaxID=28068 RepID=UPI0018CB8715|nr:pyridoxal phosphate-dependent aminotransferase [Rubrivivax gelatinosus]MBG6079169.1 aspartate/methionine/tyrosine aminotransferase [Rubrivivax gelatinosus]